MIAIDFAPGLHGHFLEYVINRFIFDVPCQHGNIFQITGAAHNINFDPIYQKNKIAVMSHYSSFNHPYPKDTEKIIWIRHDRELDFILLVNVFERCSTVAMKSNDFNAEDIKKLHLDSMFDVNASEKDLRNNWFNKLEEFHNQQWTSLRYSTLLPTFDFDYRSFFNLSDFISELDKVAEFVSVKLNFNDSLVDLWKEFISRNRGFYLYQTANKILDKIIENSHETIEEDWRLHAYLNYRLSKIFRIYDGLLFEDDQYPKDTTSIHKLIIEHIESFDSRF